MGNPKTIQHQRQHQRMKLPAREKGVSNHFAYNAALGPSSRFCLCVRVCVCVGFIFVLRLPLLQPHWGNLGEIFKIWSDSKTRCDATLALISNLYFRHQKLKLVPVTQGDWGWVWAMKPCRYSILDCLCYRVWLTADKQCFHRDKREMHLKGWA